jgi:NAD(P)H-hydrate epimerase
VRVLTVAEARAFDRHVIESIGVPGLVLMENAALAVVEAIVERFPDARRIGLICGPGNNGADGFAVARQLVTRGFDTMTLAATFGARRSDDCAAQRAILAALDLAPGELAAGFAAADLAPLDGCDLLVDALFGLGLTRALDGEWARLVAALAGRAPVLAIDLPSGLDGDRATPIGPALAAALTVTFVAPKPAHVLDPACDLCGEVVVADLGVPFEPVAGPGALHLLLGEELGRALPPRPAAAHKGAFGHALIVAGSRGKAGAMVLAARAAVAGGAGLTTVATPEPLAEALAAGCPEAMSLPLPATSGGTLALSALPQLLAAAAERSALAVGPGLGRDEATDELVRALVAQSATPLVLDADGLNAFAGRLDELAGRAAPAVLTPHPGELARLFDRSVAEVQADRLAAVREAARRSGAVVVLKGRNSLVAAPDGEAWVNSTGGPEMASGGSGDVLTGLVAARLAQGETAEFAACLSVHLHGLAGELAAVRLGGPAVPAGELLAELGAAFRRLAEEA